MTTDDPTPQAFTRHLSAAQGYLELRLPLDCWNELGDSEPAPPRGVVSVLGVRIRIYQAMERWGAMAEVCRHLATVEPGKVAWVISLAFATRRAENIPAAQDILLRAMVRFPLGPRSPSTWLATRRRVGT